MAEIEELQDAGFVAPHGGSLLDNDVFVKLLGQVSLQQSIQLGVLQRSLHLEMRERDRLINQIGRTRRAAMRFAVEMAEARQRAAREGYPIAGLLEHKDLATDAACTQVENQSGETTNEVVADEAGQADQSLFEEDV